MIYTSRGMRRRGDSDKWEVVLSRHDPLSGEQVPTYHTVEAQTEKQAKKRFGMSYIAQRQDRQKRQPFASGKHDLATYPQYRTEIA